MKYIIGGIGVFLTLIVFSCEPRIVLHRLSYEEFKPNLHGLRYYVKDTSLVNYLGTWKGDQMEITFSKIVKHTDEDKQFKRQLIEGVLIRHQVINEQEKKTFQIPIYGTTFMKNTLGVFGLHYHINARLNLDSLTKDVLIWENQRGHGLLWAEQRGEKWYLFDREVILDLKVPEELKLKRVK